MMKDFRNGEWVEEPYYELLFYTDRSGGYGFPCDADGNPLFDKMTDCAKKNYERCMELGLKHFPYAFNQIERYVNRWREPNSGICKCGKRIDLYDEYLGACECPHCGRWWNLFGQELKKPEHWDDDGELDYEY